MVDTPFDQSYVVSFNVSIDAGTKTHTLHEVCQEMLKLLKKGSVLADFGASASTMVNTLHSLNSSSMYTVPYSCFVVENSKIGSWIVHSGATNNLTPHMHLLTHKTTLNHHILVRLPNGSLKFVTVVWKV